MGGKELEVDAPGALAPRRGRPRARGIERVHVPRRAFELRLRETWAYRYAIPFIGFTILQRRFRGAWLGWLWIPLRPTLQMLSRGFVFGGMLHLGSGDRPYLIFLMVGQTSWDFFDRAVYWGFKGIQSQRRILQRAPIPWTAAVTATLVPAAADALPFALIGGLAAVYYKVTEGSFYLSVSAHGLLRFAVGFALLTVWAVAISLVVSPLIIGARDVRFILRYLLSFWYFLTPVLYAISTLPPRYQAVAKYNPIAAPIEMIKDGVLETGAPSSASLLVSLVGVVFVLPLGLLICSHAERRSHARL